MSILDIETFYLKQKIPSEGYRRTESEERVNCQFERTRSFYFFKDLD